MREFVQRHRGHRCLRSALQPRDETAQGQAEGGLGASPEPLPFTERGQGPRLAVMVLDRLEGLQGLLMPGHRTGRVVLDGGQQSELVAGTARAVPVPALLGDGEGP